MLALVRDEKKNRFWNLQILGWSGLCILTYFSLTIWYTTEEILSNVSHIVAQAICGLLLSLLLRKVFLLIWDIKFSIRMFLAVLSIFVFAMLWNALRMQLFILIVLSDELPLQEHPDWIYDKASIFFDFGKDISPEEGNLYYWDDVFFGEVLERPSIQTGASSSNLNTEVVDLPIQFDRPNKLYVLSDYGGASTSIVDDPVSGVGKVAVTRKFPNSLYWAGTTMSGSDGLASAIPISSENSKMTVWVYSEEPQIIVRLKLESHDDPQHAMEMENEISTNGEWQPVVFDFNDARAGDYEQKVASTWGDFGGWFYSAVLIFVCWSALYHLIKYADLLRLERDKATDQAERAKYKSAQAMVEAKEAQLQMLRYQLNPHFLFNTLNTVYALIKLANVDTAKSMISKLSRFLRYSLDSDPNELIKLSQEVEALQLYLSIEQVRFQDRLEFTYDIEPEAAHCLVPSLIMQPLVENSIKYAVSAREDTGVITLSAIVVEDWLEIRLTDNGPDDDAVVKEHIESTGIGIRNIKQRLETLYEGEFIFELHPLSPSGLEVLIKIKKRQL